VNISNVIWTDNKPVIILSTLAGKTDRKNKKRLDVDCTGIIKICNKHMGGVDLLCSVMGRYKMRMRHKGWHIRLCYHLFDMSMVDVCLLCRRVQSGKQILKKHRYLPRFVQRQQSVCVCLILPHKREGLAMIWRISCKPRIERNPLFLIHLRMNRTS
jgi:hypothetical protein